MAVNLFEDDKIELSTAKIVLENPGLVAKITSVTGNPVEKRLDLLPDNRKKISVRYAASVSEGI